MPANHRRDRTLIMGDPRSIAIGRGASARADAAAPATSPAASVGARNAQRSIAAISVSR